MFRPSIPLVAVVAAAALPAGFAVSFQAGSRDDAGRFMGGTEMRVLAAHAGKLYAGNGYWEDTPGSEGKQGSQILVLDGPGARWRLDQDFDERLPDGRPRNLAVSALDEVRFATDGNGKPLSAPVSLQLLRDRFQQRYDAAPSPSHRAPGVASRGRGHPLACCRREIPNDRLDPY